LTADLLPAPGGRPDGKRLFILGCSQAKSETAGLMPAVTRYDGPLFRVLRAFLRNHAWPERLSLAVLSARHGLIGALTGVERYDQRLTPFRASQMQEMVTRDLTRLLATHETADLFMGKKYLQAINLEALGERAGRLRFIEGAIGRKLAQLRTDLGSLGAAPGHKAPVLPRSGRPLYFLPDWDDFLDIEFDFRGDRLSAPRRGDRREAHGLELMRPHRICDGVLVSVAQLFGSKGLLKRVTTATMDSLAPKPVRRHFGLLDDQWAFGDCGAFSYADREEPAISVDQAIALYDLYRFDLGASVDHIPLREIRLDGKRVRLATVERRRRMEKTRSNAEEFLRLAASRAVRFQPVGVIQGLEPGDYAAQVGDYLDMGYRYLALGGLVPRPDSEVLEIAAGVCKQVVRRPERVWLHLMGIFRPKLQDEFRRLAVNSFDSATYFRKAWLRSDQNYLGVDGTWFAAIRVPPTSDPRMWARMLLSGVPGDEIRRREAQALAALRDLDSDAMAIEPCIEVLDAYDSLRGGSGKERAGLLARYRRVLLERPWKRCPCSVCRTLGIDVIIFRGYNRNKRRGAHNTWRLFERLNRGTGPRS